MRAGSLLIVGFEGKEAPPALLERIAAGTIGGVVLFARNLGTLDEIVALTRSLHDAVPAGEPPLWVSIDQEGGRVQRIRAPLSVWPAMARLGALRDAKLSQEVGAALGAELFAMGFNVDYAPVLDVHTNPSNPVIGDRAFGVDVADATMHALAFWRGLEAANVRGCGKHFPGHGDTATDSHLTLPQVDHNEARLRSIELEPFRRAVVAGIPLLMTAHVVYPAIDARPATMSPRWLTAILRIELGFRGVILSDDLDMKAVAERFPIADVVRESLLAGCDSFLACRDREIQIRAELALDEGAARDAQLNARLQESIARMHAFRSTLKRPAPDAAAAQSLADRHTSLVAKLR